MAMGSSSGLFLFSTILINLVAIITVAQPDFVIQSCSDMGNYSSGSTYGANLNSLLSSLSSDTTPFNDGFYSFSVGEGTDKVNSIVLCRGDVSLNDCLSCTKDSAQKISQVCPNSIEAMGWYDFCMLRYSNQTLYGVVEYDPTLFFWNVNNVSSDVSQFNQALANLMNELNTTAASGDSLKFAAGNTTAGSQPIYALVQCTPDLSEQECSTCLVGNIGQIPTCCYGKVGGRVVKPSCNIRFEIYPILQVYSTPGAKKGGISTTMIIIITVSSVTVVAALLGFWYYSSSRGKRRKLEAKGSHQILLRQFKGEISRGTDDDHSEEMHCIDLSTIQAATNNFSNANKLGEGGFGPVYKGLLNGKEIAVKRLSMKSSQGIEEFRNEVKVIAKLQHKNLVRLLGYCLEGDEKLLVYEYMANTSLDAFLFDAEKCIELDWAKRAHIIIGTARGLQYLHEDSRLKIIHRDMKASNVLLDEEMNPKISDFGTARIFGVKQIEASTERVVGTYGYMAPEYALEGLISVKSDIYSFGVLMLEIISGKKNRGIYHAECGQNLLTYAWKLWNEDKGLELIDLNIVDTCPTSEVLRWIHIALLCVQDDPAERPNMSSVVLMLGSQAVNLPQPSTPPYSVGRFITMDDLSSISGTGTGFLTSDKSSTSASN